MARSSTADDVVASLTRWGKQSIYGKDLFSQVTSLRAADQYTVELKLKDRYAIVLINLALPNSFAAIYPKEIVEKFPPSLEGHGVRRHRPVPVRRVEARPVRAGRPL